MNLNPNRFVILQIIQNTNDIKDIKKFIENHEHTHDTITAKYIDVSSGHIGELNVDYGTFKKLKVNNIDGLTDLNAQKIKALLMEIGNGNIENITSVNSNTTNLNVVNNFTSLNAKIENLSAKNANNENLNSNNLNIKNNAFIYNLLVNNANISKNFIEDLSANNANIKDLSVISKEIIFEISII
jgi:hypothetical protein